tara:strand:- start:34 stop:225 length:192 start_codon:yes stop_codon:yes gene_type:complete
MSAKDKPVSKASNDKFNQNFDRIFGKKDDEIKLKDSIKLGLSPSTSVEWWDCRKPELVEKIRN